MSNPVSPMQQGLPLQQGLYDPCNEHDACGVGFVAHIKGRKSHSIVEQGLLILRAGVNVLRIAPPLVITKKEIDEGLARLTRALERYTSDGGSR